MIQIEARHKAIVDDILARHMQQAKVYVFGSRAKGEAEKFSDLDLLIDGEGYDLNRMGELKEAFSESDLPFFVDVVNAEVVSPEFANAIEADKQLWV